MLSRCSCIIAFPHQSRAAWWFALSRMGRETMVLTGTRDNTSPQQFPVSLTLLRHALHLSTTWKECRLPREEGWVSETAKSAKDLKKYFSGKKNPGDTVVKTTYEDGQTRFFSSLQYRAAVASKGKWAKPEKSSYCCKYSAILLFYLIAHIKSFYCCTLHLYILIKYSYIHLHSLPLLLSYCYSFHRESC